MGCVIARLRKSVKLVLSMISILIFSAAVYPVVVFAEAALSPRLVIKRQNPINIQKPETKIRVLLKDGLRSVHLKGLGLRFGLDGDLRFSQSNNLVITAKYRNFTIQDGNQIYQIKGPRLRVEAEELFTAGEPIPKQILIFPRSADRTRLVAEMGLEEYLLGVVPAEMPSRWPLEVLKAQAVASRSYAMATMNARAGEDYHLESTILHQVFSYYDYQNLVNNLQKKVEVAVAETAGEYLVWEKSQRVFRAYYHSDCGGKTEDAHSVWEYSGKTGTVSDSGCQIRPSSKWEVNYSAEGLSNVLSGSMFASKVGSGHGSGEILSDVKIAKRTVSGRTDELQLTWAPSGKTGIIKANDFRKALGFKTLKSAMFEIEKKDKDFLFLGRGFGHGVGMCQLGARLMAVGGAKYQDILKRYFPKTELIRMGPTIGPKIAPAIGINAVDNLKSENKMVKETNRKTL